MNSTNEKGSLVNIIRNKMMQVLSNALIRQAEDGVRHSTFFFVSEAKVPVELLKEDNNKIWQKDVQNVV